MSKSAIDKFIQDMMEFIPDETLHAVTGQSDSVVSQYQMAADSEVEKLTEYKVGVLTNDNRDMLARVFKNDRKEQFELYFLAEEEKLSNYPIIFEPKSFKYYIIDQNGHVSIPYGTNLDPLIQPLAITFPIESHSIDLAEQKAFDGLSIKSDELTMTNISKGSKALVVFKDESGEKLYRMVPLRESGFTVSLPASPLKSISISIYK